MPPRSHASVTFVQVAVVLAIIAFVAAVLFPVFHHPNYEHRGFCGSNMKQLSLATIEYEQDNGNDFPSGTTVSGNGWAGQLYPYIKSVSVYRCPDDAAEGAFVSYAENQNLVRHSLNDLTAPAVTVELYEFTTLGCDPSAAEAVSAAGLSAPQDSKRHDSSTFNSTYSLNFVAADGHVKYLMPGQVSGGPNAIRAKTLPQGAYVETFAIK